MIWPRGHMGLEALTSPHLNRFSRFGTAHARDHATRTTVTTVRILYATHSEQFFGELKKVFLLFASDLFARGAFEKS